MAKRPQPAYLSGRRVHGPAGRPEAAEVARRCREAGLLLTPQRLVLYRALCDAGDHPSPEALYERVRGRMPSLSLATVYKTLDALVRIGLASEVPATGNTKRYDANMDRHHHLVCTRCHAVRDHYDPALDRIPPPPRLPGFTAHRLSVQIQGLCDVCARGPADRPTPHGSSHAARGGDPPWRRT